MFHYLYCGNILASTVSLPALRISKDSSPTLSINSERSRRHYNNVTWHYHWFTPGGDVWTSFSRIPDGYLLRFPSLSDFVISFSADQITCYPTPKTPIETIRHLLLDQVLPRCLAHQGMLMLHASAVALKHGVVLFLGSTGEGKSTLAGYFHRAGDEAISDDCVRILNDHDAMKAIPSYGGLRLWKDAHQFLFPGMQDSVPVAHYSSKQRIHLSQSADLTAANHESPAYPVLAVVFLSSTNGNLNNQPVQLQEIPRRQAFIELMKHSFRLDPTDYYKLQDLMQKMAAVLSRVAVYQLTLPHRFDALPQARQLILDALG
jgi:hypothetical protein